MKDKTEFLGQQHNKSTIQSLKSNMLLGASIIALGSTVQCITVFVTSVAATSFIVSDAFARGDGGGSDGGGGGGSDGGGGGGSDGGGDGDGGDGDGGVIINPCDGTENRAVRCRDFRGNIVADSFCDPVGAKPASTRPCTATCTSGEVSDPLIFDLDGNGISLLSAEEGVMFDIDNDGEPDQTGWVDSKDGLLALDENGNGIIDNQSELFGTAQKGAYKQLAEYDSNDDNIIDEQDAVWKHLRMWIDKNSNGKTDKKELHTMDDLGMKSIDLNYETVDEINNGNKVVGVGKYTILQKGKEVINKVVEALFDFIT